MAVTVIPSETMPPQFSVDAGVTWLTPVCINDWSFDGATSTTDEDTFCGRFTAVGLASGTGTVNALASTTPAAGELSAEMALSWWVGKTPLLYRIANPSPAGTDLYMNAAVLITNYNVSGGSPGNVHYSFTFATQGTIDNTP